MLITNCWIIISSGCNFLTLYLQRGDELIGIQQEKKRQPTSSQATVAHDDRAYRYSLISVPVLRSTLNSTKYRLEDDDNKKKQEPTSTESLSLQCYHQNNLQHLTNLSPAISISLEKGCEFYHLLSFTQNINPSLTEAFTAITRRAVLI